MKSYTQDRLSARRSDTTGARLAEVGRRWCHCLYAKKACVWHSEKLAKRAILSLCFCKNGEYASKDIS